MYHFCIDMDMGAVRKIIDTNVLGLCLFTREVIKDMRDRGVDDGHIFHIGRFFQQFPVNIYF